jgi:FAD/FMN-containing dehydrogenase
MTFTTLAGRLALVLALCRVLPFLVAADAATFRECINKYLTTAPSSAGLRLIFPEDPAYASYQVRNFQPKAQSKRPIAFGLPLNEEHVAALVTCASDVPFTARGGGHSYEGTSLLDGGLVIDMARLNATNISDDKSSVQIGAGQRLGEVFLQLMNAGPFALPGGRCPGVGIAGFTQGGGVGAATRRLGWMVDNLLSVRGVTPEGKIVTANSTSNPDLFWAIKGGGPNYLLLTDLTFRIYKAPSQVTYLKLTAPQSSIKQFLAAYTDWKPWTLPTTYAMVEAVLGSAEDSWLDIFYWGPKDKVMQDINASPLAQVPGLNVSADSSINHTWSEALTKITGESLSNMGAAAVLANQYTGSNTETGTTPPQGKAAKPFKASSLMFKAPLSPEAQEALVTALTKAADGEPVGSKLVVQLKALGGSVLSDIDSTSSALPHRDVLFESQIYTDNLDVDVMQRMVRKVKAAMVPFLQGHPFFYNHLDCDDFGNEQGVARWRVYFGENAERLIAVKAQVDPQGRLDALKCSSTLIIPSVIGDRVQEL